VAIVVYIAVYLHTNANQILFPRLLDKIGHSDTASVDNLWSKKSPVSLPSALDTNTTCSSPCLPRICAPAFRPSLFSHVPPTINFVEIGMTGRYLHGSSLLKNLIVLSENLFMLILCFNNFCVALTNLNHLA